MCQTGFLHWDRCATLAGGRVGVLMVGEAVLVGGGGVGHRWDQRVHGNSALAVQFCCEPKNTPK